MTPRPMHRQDRQLPQEEAWALLTQGTYGVLSVVGDEGWPYAVPMHYTVMDGQIYLHCAKTGYKLDAIARDDRVCFTVTLREELVQDHATSLYESVVVLGRAALVTDQATGRILGAQMVCPRATDLVGELTLAIQKGITAGELATVIHPHPTFSEMLFGAAESLRPE